MSQRELKFEGLTEEEILDLPKDAVEALILLGEPRVPNGVGGDPGQFRA